MCFKKKTQMLAIALAIILMLTLTACGSTSPAAAPSLDKAATEQTQTPSSTAITDAPQTPVASSQAEPVSTVLDQYYANDRFMIEMLVNDDIIITEQDSSLIFTTPEEHSGIVISIIPGIQNLAAAGELSKSMVTNSFEGAATGEIEDATLFGARAKLVEYVVADEREPFMGIQAAAIVNQSCYFMNAMFHEGISEAEGRLMVDMFSGINVLTPNSVDQSTQTAAYTSRYETELRKQAVKPANNTKAKSVAEWVYLPYEFYSWWGDPGDYYDSFPNSYFEPDWDYYSDPSDYWSWGWDENYNWGFYDEYAEFYDWETYQEYQDYYDDWDGGGGYGDDYAEYYDWALEANDYDWSDPGDYYDDGYDIYSDPGDGADEWSDPGDSYDEGYGDYIEDGYGDYFE